MLTRRIRPFDVVELRLAAFGFGGLNSIAARHPGQESAAVGYRTADAEFLVLIIERRIGGVLR